MKKAIATLLSVCMVFSILAQGSAAYAEEAALSAPETAVSAETEEAQDAVQDTDNTPEPVLPDEETDGVRPPEAPADEPEEGEAEAAEPEAEAQTPEDAEAAADEADLPDTPQRQTASIEVTLRSGLPLRGARTFQIRLTGADGREAGTQQVVLPQSGLATAAFDDLETGSYTLTVTGSGFAAYTQHITVDKANTACAVQLYTGFLAGYTYAAGSAHPGVLRIGDADGDGAVTQQDAAALIDAMEAGRADTGLDLDGSGTVDLVDLQMLAANLDDTRDIAAAVSIKVPQSLTQATLAEDTAVAAGTVEGLLSGETALTLQTEQPISEQAPAVIDFAFAGQADTGVEMEGIVLQTPASGDAAVSAATVTVEYTENGETKTMDFAVRAAALARMGGAVIQPDGSIVLDFGGQIAVKKVSIKVTATAGSGNLAEITSVEFLNDMESRIPAPQMDIPENLRAEAGSQTFTLYWDAAVNVTGYEVRITLGDRSETVRTAANTLTVNRFDGKKLANQTTYTVAVQSLNGEWRSGYSEAVTVTPKADKLPPAPDALTLTGRFQRLEASWKDMKDTDRYNLYYRKAGESDFIRIEGIETNRYTIQGLENNTRYEVYVTGVNELGEGPASLTSVAATADVSPVQMPAYKLINTPGAAGEVTAHIVSATHEAGYMKDSPLDSGKTAWGILDNDFASWYGMDDWDDGASYPDNGGVRVTFDAAYTIGSISLAQSEDKSYYGNVRVYARGEGGREYQVPGVTITRHTAGSRSYHTIKIPGGVTTDYLRVCVGYVYWNSPVSISEIRFYAYDSLEDDILALYADDLHLTLRADVDEADIQALQTRLDTPDAASGELHPDRELLQRELDNASGLLQAAGQGIVNVHTGITAQKDTHLGFTGLNAWQPLGVSAHAGEQLVIYVGSNTLATGTTAPLQLIATQYNAEHGTVASRPIALKVGRNEISVPELVTFDAEHGGALYVQYTGSSETDQYAVRVSGGTAIPVLDLYGVTDAETRAARVTAYIQQLEAHAAALEAGHEAQHAGSGLAAVDHAYDPAECILNTTDILLDQMMLSVPVTQVLAGLGSGSAADKAARLLDSMDAMDQMMTLFYQHKGLTNLAGAGDKNRLPAQHLNIRYMRMFAGAFMYAAGNHIGIGWDSVPGLAQGDPVTLSETGDYLSGGYFGWGIAHEIGHNINQSSYAVAEVTNNYFSQLSQAYEGVRFGYEAVYRKVTSGTKGASDDVFTQLALYWQLHLAYDTGYEYQIYDSYEELFQSLFFARVDTYARNPAAAPAPGGVALRLSSNADQNLMRLAAAAAQKDLTDFFTRWGMTPDDTTAAYMAQFPAETRALYYVNDTARDYAFTHDSAATIAGKDVIAPETSAQVSEDTPNQVQLTLAAQTDTGLLLGYEIARITYENGVPTTQVVGFATGNTYTDTVTTMNNRTVAYQITAVDQFLNRSESVTLPAVKISHDGSHDKSLWTASTNMTSAQDETPSAGEHDPCEPEPVSAIAAVIDNSKETTYTGQAASGQATVTLDFHKTLAVTGFKYTVTAGTPIEAYTLQVHTDGAGWTTVAEGSFGGDPVNTVYFRNEAGDPWVCTYDADQLRLVIQAPAGTEISISELDVLGPTGDNVWLETAGMGYLSAPYTYGDGASDVIPAGSLVFTGRYKGNPAYNVVLLYDQDGNLVGGLDSEGSLVAQQIILAPVPAQGELGEVSDGWWVYWIEPEALRGLDLPESVRAELYRVDNATTNAGQRLTSDTLPVQLPAELPQISIQA